MASNSKQPSKSEQRRVSVQTTHAPENVSVIVSTNVSTNERTGPGKQRLWQRSGRRLDVYEGQ